MRINLYDYFYQYGAQHLSHTTPSCVRDLQVDLFSFSKRRIYSFMCKYNFSLMNYTLKKRTVWIFGIKEKSK